MTKPPPDPRLTQIQVPGGREERRTHVSESGAHRLALAVETIRDTYQGVTGHASQPLVDELTRVAELLRDPPEGTDSSQLVLEADRLLGAIEGNLARTRRSA